MKMHHFFKKKRDQQFTRLLQPYVLSLYQTAYRFCGNRDDAEDLVQDVLIQVYSSENDISRIEKLKPWLIRVLYNKFIDQNRRDNRSPIDYRNSDDEVFINTQATAAEQPEAQILLETQLNQVQKQIERLSADHKAVLVLHDMEGYALTELQEILQTPVGTLKSRLHRARLNLRRYLSGKPKD